MTYYIDPIVFYLMDIASGMKTLFFVVFTASLIALFILIAVIVEGHFSNFSEKMSKNLLRGMKLSITFLILSCILFILTPSEEAMNKMLIASFVTKENVDMTVEGAKEVVDYIIESAKEINEISESSEE